MAKEYFKMTDAELRKIKNTAPSRSLEAKEARIELTRRASQDPRNTISIGSPNPPNR
jgi:hypothetical protein